MTNQGPWDVFDFQDYRVFLKFALEQAISDRGLSYRYFARKAALASPNYLQRVIKGERGLSAETARLVGEALRLSGYELDYFLALVRLDQVDLIDRPTVEEDLRRIAGHAQSEARDDETIHSSWINGVIWCLAGIEGFEPDAAKLFARLRGAATKEEIQRSIDFLMRKGYIARVSEDNPQVFEQRNIRFKVQNDKRRLLDLQRSHIRYLEMAKQRLVDDLADREYQGLTIAIPESKFADVKANLREFISGLSESLAYSDKSDIIIRIQCAAYKVTRR